jgi:LDH2 family malate/lactate/ureidoglycolate dehydrogenase
MEEERRANGIPIEQGAWQLLSNTAARLKVPVPAGGS